MTHYINIGQLLQVRNPKKPLIGNDFNKLPLIENAYLSIDKQGIISDFGSMQNFTNPNQDKTLDVNGKIIMPAWIDSHTHLVFAASRADEFVDKINGLSYEEIAAKGGGILNSAKKLNEIDETLLYRKSVVLLNEAIKYGTGAIEIKSGYGLSPEGELKMLRVIKKLKENFKIPIKATFLGAHAIPEKYNKNDYIDLLINQLLPVIAQEKLADYIDVFCEKNYFSADETSKILEAGLKYGLKPKIHANQFTSIGCIEKAIRHQAISVDHLEIMKNIDYKILSNTNTIATLLPGCSFFINIPYAPAKKMIDYNIPIVLATDFNPGSTPTFNMNFIVSLGSIKLKLTPEQAINAATINAAFAMEIQDTYGSIARGKKANFLILKNYISHYNEIPYFFATNPLDHHIIN